MRTLKGPDHAFRMVKNIYRLIKHKKMIEMKKQVTPGETPEQITISMIDQDLKDGVSKSDMAVKYGIKPWEVDEMFKHPLLKGRRPSRKKALSFTFVDDMTESTQFPNSMEDVTDEVDPNQITLEQAIDEAIEGVGEVRNQMQETQDAIIDMLSPTQFETPEETLLNSAQNTIADLHQAVEKSGGEVIAKVNGPIDEDDEIELPSFEDTLDLVKEQQEEELEMDDDTFEL